MNAMGMAGEAPVRERHVARMFGQLEQAASELVGAVNELEQRLGPLMLPEPPVAVQGDKNPEHLPAAAEALLAVVQAVRGQTHRINRLTGRVEL